MAYNYEGAKKAYQSMTREQQQQFVENNKNDANFQRFVKEYTAEMSGKSTPASTPTTVSSSSAKTDTTTTPKVSTASSAKTYTAVPEYQGTGSNKTNTYQNQGAGNYSYDTGTQYYEKQGTPANTNYSSTRNAWDALSYEQQQEKLNQNPNLREGIIRIGGTIKEGPTGAKTSPYQNQGEGQYVYNPKTGYYEKKGGTQGATQGWDYQDNSQARMDEIANNLNNYRITNPNLFDNWGSFYNFFIAGKGRTPEQEKFLTDYYNNMKRYNEYDNLSSDEVGGMIARGEIPDDYLNYLKNSDPQRWAEIQGARKDVEDQIMNETYLNTAASQAGFDMGDSDWWKWNKTEMGYRDVNNDGLDDRLYHEPTKEELKLVEENNQYEQERAKLTDAMKWLQEDLTNQYPDADLSTIMILTSDRGNKIQRALDTLAVNQTKVQGSLKYLQNERATMDDAGQNTINELQKQYGMYYDYSPEGISKLAQAKYAATNVTLDQADNGTDTQKQMALQNVLDGYYQKYGDIIQRSEAQVINDVMALAKNKGISLSQALQENFLKYLRQKPGFEALSSGGLTPTVSFEKVGDTGYIFTVNPDGTYSLESVGGAAIGSGVAGGTYNNDTGVMNFAESGMKGLGLKNNNPGNITDTNVGEVGRNGKFAVFETPEDGFDALVAKIQNAQNGKSKNYPATATLYDFFAKYAPSSDNNNPKAYAESVAKQLGVSANTQIKDLDTVKFAAAIAKHDSGYNYDTYGMFRGGSGDNNNGYDPLLKDFFQKDPTKLTKDQWAKIKNMGYDERTYLSMRDNYLKNLAKEPDASTVKILDTLGYLMTNYPGREELMASIGTKFLPGDYGAKMGDYLSYVDYIKQNLTMDNLVKLKQGGATFGSLTEGEWPRIEASATRLSNSMSKDKYLGELLDIYNTYAKNAGMGVLTLDDINRMYGGSSSGTPTIEPMKGMENSNTQVNDGDIDYDAVFASL